MSKLTLTVMALLSLTVLAAPAQPSPPSSSAGAVAPPAAGSEGVPAPDAAGRGRSGGGGRGGRGARGGQQLPRPNPLPPFYDPTLSLEKRVDDLVSRLSLEEKVSLMGMQSAAIPRLGISGYYWWNEALHGLANGTATVFPNPTGLAAAWDVNLQHRLANVIGQEGRARHAAQGSGLDFGRPTSTSFATPAGAAPRRPTAKTLTFPAASPWRSSAECKATTPFISRPSPLPNTSPSIAAPNRSATA